MRCFLTVAVLLLVASDAVASPKRIHPASVRRFDRLEGIGPAPDDARIKALLGRFDDRSQRLVPLPKRGRGVARASSTQLYRGFRHAPNNAVDHDFRSAWVEAEDGPGVGSWIEIEVDPSARARLFGVVLGPGFARNATMFRDNPRPRESLMTLRCGETGTLVLSYILEVADTRRAQLFVLGPNDRIESPGRCRLRLEVLSVYPGERFEDLSVSELRLVVAEPRRQRPAQPGTAQNTP